MYTDVNWCRCTYTLDFNGVASRVLHKRMRIVSERVDILTHLVTYLADHQEKRHSSINHNSLAFFQRSMSDGTSSARGSFISPNISTNTSTVPTPNLSPSHRNHSTSSFSR